ncbi:MAG TPA: hypothetical protein VMY35_18545, partial [Phycisphaerae bacterium]|nr:hypothetical protein [Phycisphaerae bacterium]
MLTRRTIFKRAIGAVAALVGTAQPVPSHWILHRMGSLEPATMRDGQVIARGLFVYYVPGENILVGVVRIGSFIESIESRKGIDPQRLSEHL